MEEERLMCERNGRIVFPFCGLVYYRSEFKWVTQRVWLFTTSRYRDAPSNLFRVFDAY